jgi:integrase
VIRLTPAKALFFRDLGKKNGGSFGVKTDQDGSAFLLPRCYPHLQSSPCRPSNYPPRGINGLEIPEKGRVEYFDKTTPNFALRVTASGHRSWVCFYRHKGDLRRYTLGPYPQLGLGDARQKAKEILRRAAKGEDPAAEKNRERKAETFRELAERYLEEHAKAKKRSWRADRNIIHKDLIPRFGSRKAAEITRRDILEMLKAIKGRGAAIQSNRTLEIARKLFNWAIGEELVESSPCDRVPKLSPENQRTRVLSAGEIRTLWTTLDNRPPLVAAAYRLMLATGQRSIEVLGAKRDEIGADGWWTIPSGRVKNKTEHRVWLNEIARRVIADIEPHALEVVAHLDPKTRATAKEWIFPSWDGGHLRYLHKTHGRLCKASGIADFKIHDLRRTAASCMSAAGISRLTIRKILNHKEREITAVYDRYSYAPEIRHALDAWGARIEEIVSGREPSSNVASLRASA